MIEELAGLVMKQWRKSNSKFIPPVTIEKRSVIKNIQRKWDGLVEAVSGKTKAHVKQQIDELDKIFDIIWCKHQILACKHKDSNCDGCQVGAHIKWSCARDSKIPIIDLAGLNSQRHKIGEYSDYQINFPDKEESVKVAKKQRRKINQETSPSLLFRKGCDDFILEYILC